VASCSPLDGNSMSRSRTHSVDHRPFNAWFHPISVCYWTSKANCGVLSWKGNDMLLVRQ
jgi:hypothetical protein